MGTNNIPSAVSNTIIKASDHNALRSALIGDYVPRNASANAEDDAGSLGQSAYRWFQGYIKNLFIGAVADNISIVADGGDCVINVGGTERARIPQSIELLPPGMIIAHGRAGTTMAGWLYCDGTEVSRTTYARLFAEIGTAYGIGNGTTTFNVPNFKGHFLRGTDSGRGVDPDAAGRSASGPSGNTGDNVGSQQNFALQGHHHELWRASGDLFGGGGSPGISSSPVDTQTGLDSGTHNVRDAITGNHGGLAVSTETRPLNTNVNFFIKI